MVVKGDSGKEFGTTSTINNNKTFLWLKRQVNRYLKNKQYSNLFPMN